MKQKVYILLNTSGPGNKSDLMKFFGKGVDDKYEVIYYDGSPIKFPDSSILVMWAFFNEFRKFKKPIKAGQIYRKFVYDLNKDATWIFLDSDPIRGCSRIPWDSIDDHLRVCIESIYPSEAVYLTDGYSQDRWKVIQNDKKIEVKPWRTAGEHILFLLQADYYFSIRGIDYAKWCNSTIKEIRKYSNRKIILRHKASYKRSEKLLKSLIDPIDNMEIVKSGETLLDNLQNAWVSVLYTTSAGIASLVEGVPVICGSIDSVTYDVSDKEISKIENPTLYDRTDFFNKLGYKIWNKEDLQSGEVWKKIEMKLSR